VILNDHKEFIFVNNSNKGLEFSLFDSSFNLVTYKIYRTSSIGIITAHFVNKNNKNEILVAGESDNKSIFLVKFSRYGDLIWSKVYRFNRPIEVNSLTINKLDNILIGAVTNQHPSYLSSNTILVSDNGSLLNQQVIRLTNSDFYSMYGATATLDNGFILSGSGPQVGQAFTLWIMKISSQGLFEWSRLYIPQNFTTSPPGAYGVTVNAIENDRYLVMGRYGNDARGSNRNPVEMNGLLVEIDGAGNINRSNKLVLNNSNFSNPTNFIYENGFYYMIGSEGYTHVGKSMLFMKFDDNYNISFVKKLNKTMIFNRLEKVNENIITSAYTFVANKLHQYFNITQLAYFDACQAVPFNGQFQATPLTEVTHTHSIQSGISEENLPLTLNSISCLFSHISLCKNENNVDYFEISFSKLLQKDTTIHICEGSSKNFRGKTYSKAGTYLDTVSIGSSECDTIYRLNVEVNHLDSGNVEHTICLNDTLYLGGEKFYSEGVYYISEIGSNGCDSVTKLVLNQLPYNIDRRDYSICQGDSVLINGIYYQNEISFVDTISSIDHCDTLVNYNIQILPFGQRNIIAELCKGESILIGNKFYSVSGLYIDTIPTLGQCDSIYQISIIELPIDSINIEYQLCYGDTINIDNNKYFTEGQFEFRNQNIHGCDSLTFVNININDYNFDQKSYTMCHGDSIQINGIYFKNEISFVDTISSMSSCDTIVNYNVQFLPYGQRNISMEICRGESIIIGNKTYSNSGQFTDTISAQGLCDSIYHISINELPIDSIKNDYYLCQGDTLIVGNTKFFAEGQYKFSNQNIYGCDSLTILNIFINNYKLEQKNYSICHGDSIQLNGIYYKGESQFRDTLPSMINCDTIVEYRIQLLPYGLRQQSIKLCQGDTFSIGKNKYFNAGNYIDTVSAFGTCDSIILTNIVQAKVSISNTPLRLCEGDSILINGEYYSSGGEYSFIYQNSEGCDSTVKYQLLVLPTSTFNLDTFLCEGEILKIGNYSISNPGVYKLMFQNQHQCDSLLETRVISKLCHKIFIPNVFSPNDDLVNDHFSFYHEGVESLHVEIYDRWGSMVFNSSHIHFSWDGRFKGKDCITGVYAYVIKGRYNNSQEFLFKGDVTLIR